MDTAPRGDVTLVFTDVEGSTSLWEHAPRAMRAALLRHDHLLRALIATRAGYEVKTEGDAFMVAFAAPGPALAWALEAQQRLSDLPWSAELLCRPEAAVRDGHAGLRVRIGIHAGTPECRRNPITGRMDYFGPVVNRAARVAGAAHGGQILVSEACWTRALRGGAPDAHAVDLGPHRLKGLRDELRLVQVLPRALAHRRFPPARAEAIAASPRPNTGGALTVLAQAAEEMTARGEVAVHLGHVGQAGTDLEAAVTCAHAAGDDAVLGRALAARGFLRSRLARLDAAREDYVAGMDAAARAGDAWGTCARVIDLGALALRRGDLLEAHARCQAGIALAEALGAEIARTRAVANLGVVERRLGHRARAEALLTEALAAQERAGSRQAANSTRLNLGSMWSDEDRPGAASILEDVLAEARALGTPLIEAHALAGLGHLAMRADDLPEALQKRSAAAEISARIGDSLSFALNSAIACAIGVVLGAPAGVLVPDLPTLVAIQDPTLRLLCLTIRAATLAEVGDPEATGCLAEARASLGEDADVDERFARTLEAIERWSRGEVAEAEALLRASDDRHAEVRCALLLLVRRA